MSVLKHPKVYEIYSALKNEPKFNSIDMSQKLHMLERLGKTIVAFEEVGQSDKLKSLTPEFVLDNLNARGFSRTRKILEFCDKMEQQLGEFNFKNKSAEDFKAEMKFKIFGDKKQIEKERDILEG